MPNYRGQKPIKFPVLKDVDYISIFRNRNSVLEIDGKDVEGFTWRELQLHIGNSLEPGLCQYTLKFKKSDVIHSGRIRATTMSKQIINPVENNQSDILKEFKTLKDQLSKATNTGGVSFDMLLNSTKQGYEAQISFLNQQIQYKDNLISKIENEMSDLEEDLEDCNKNSNNDNKLSQYLEIGQKILNAKFGKVDTVSLKESDTSDIPESILQILGTVDYSRIDEANMNKILIGLRQYISFLPLKGQ